LEVVLGTEEGADVEFKEDFQEKSWSRLTAQDGHLLHRNWLVVVGKEARKRSGLGILENPVMILNPETQTKHLKGIYLV
jgi:hypothetical protein